MNDTKRILFAFDKFKGSARAQELCSWTQEYLKDSNFHIDTISLADGGDGSLDVLENITFFERVETDSFNPFGVSISSYFLWDDKHATAYVELAMNSGLALIDEEDYDIMLSSTYGTGVVIREAIQHGAQVIYLFVGGSASNDFGTGILHALGVVFRDKNGLQLFPNGERMCDISSVDLPLNQLWGNCKFNVITDVDNPILGSKGSVEVYARQKGASEYEMEILTEGMIHFNSLLEEYFDKKISKLRGGGAAGGVAAGLYAVLNAEICSGAEYFFEILDVENKLKAADVLVVGEGKIDQQTIQGKLTGHVLKKNQVISKSFYLLAGQIIDGWNSGIEMQALKEYSLTENAQDAEDAKKNVKKYFHKALNKLLLELDFNFS